MPTYDYECQGCGHTFEEFQSMSAEPLKKCPECGKPELQRLIGAGAGIIFKGSGFYETDYKRKEQPKPAAESTGAAKAESSSKAGDGAAKKTEGADKSPSSDGKSAKAS